MVATDRRTTGAQVDDETIEVKASSRMSETFGDRAQVDDDQLQPDGAAHRRGADRADKTTAEQVVARVANVRSVVNELTVGPLNSFTERSNDTYVTTKVKASLVDAKDLFANSFKVDDPARRRLPDGPRHRARGRPAPPRSRAASAASSKVVRVFEVITESELAQHPAQDACAAARRRPPARRSSGRSALSRGA